MKKQGLRFVLAFNRNYAFLIAYPLEKLVPIFEMSLSVYVEFATTSFKENVSAYLESLSASK